MLLTLIFHALGHVLMGDCVDNCCSPPHQLPLSQVAYYKGTEGSRFTLRTCQQAEPRSTRCTFAIAWTPAPMCCASVAQMGVCPRTGP